MRRAEETVSGGKGAKRTWKIKNNAKPVRTSATSSRRKMGRLLLSTARFLNTMPPDLLKKPSADFIRSTKKAPLPQSRGELITTSRFITAAGGNAITGSGGKVERYCRKMARLEERERARQEAIKNEPKKLPEGVKMPEEVKRKLERVYKKQGGG